MLNSIELPPLIMQTPRQSIANYLRAKDENRPYLMRQAFAPAATLMMVVKAGTISFPPAAQGIETITDVLVRRFGQTFENVRTLCLGAPPADDDTRFACNWIVGMSEKENGTVRVGCGRYDWSFQPQSPRLADQLTITIEAMQVLPPDSLLPIMEWLSMLPLPWCPVQTLLGKLPQLDGLEPVNRCVSEWSG